MFPIAKHSWESKCHETCSLWGWMPAFLHSVHSSSPGPQKTPLLLSHHPLHRLRPSQLPMAWDANEGLHLWSVHHCTWSWTWSLLSGHSSPVLPPYSYSLWEKEAICLFLPTELKTKVVRTQVVRRLFGVEDRGMVALQKAQVRAEGSGLWGPGLLSDNPSTIQGAHVFIHLFHKWEFVKPSLYARYASFGGCKGEKDAISVIKRPTREGPCFLKKNSHEGFLSWMDMEGAGAPSIAEIGLFSQEEETTLRSEPVVLWDI